MAKLLYSSDESEKNLKPLDWALNTSTNEIIQITEISSAIFGNDKHLLKLNLIDNNFFFNGEIIGYLLDPSLN